MANFLVLAGRMYKDDVFSRMGIGEDGKKVEMSDIEHKIIKEQSKIIKGSFTQLQGEQMEKKVGSQYAEFGEQMWADYDVYDEVVKKTGLTDVKVIPPWKFDTGDAQSVVDYYGTEPIKASFTGKDKDGKTVAGKVVVTLKDEDSITVKQMDNWNIIDKIEVKLSGLAKGKKGSYKQLIAEEITSDKKKGKAPKKWWDEKVKEIKKGNPDYTEEQVDATIGKIWWGMDPKVKAKINKTYRGSEEDGKGYKIGEVVKLNTPSEWHNFWVVIVTKDEVGYTGVVEGRKIGKVDCSKIVQFNDEDVKWSIGTREEDIAGLGEERHKTEVVTLIDSAMKCNISSKKGSFAYLAKANKLELKAEVSGADEAGIVFGLQEIEKAVEAGYLNGGNSNDNGGYSFEVKTTGGNMETKKGSFAQLMAGATEAKVGSFEQLSKKEEIDPKQLEMGIKEEAEHKGTFEKMKKNPDMTLEEFQKSIAEEHITKDKEYYTKLLKFVEKKDEKAKDGKPGEKKEEPKGGKPVEKKEEKPMDKMPEPKSDKMPEAEMPKMDKDIPEIKKPMPETPEKMPAFSQM